jgi:NIMA (never in mitosis gene a)-related kinase
MRAFTRVKVLGEGGFGTAILARHKETGSYVVIKEVHLSRLKPSDRESATQEAAVLHALHCPYIVGYVASFQENGNLYIAMEYADGGDLAGRIERQHGTPFTEDQVLGYFVQIAIAIKYIHDRRILHRDLKTQNIFLTKSGTVKLGDFGIARVLERTLQMCRTQIGTPYYLSPEMCEGRMYNNKTDIWSLGCVLYELCTLRHAFDARNLNQLVVNIVRGKHPPISSSFSAGLRNLVDRMLRKDPAERPSIDEILGMPQIRGRLPRGDENWQPRTPVRKEPRARVDARRSPAVRRKSGYDLAQLYQQQRREAQRNRERFEAAARGLDVNKLIADAEAEQRSQRRAKSDVREHRFSLEAVASRTPTKPRRRAHDDEWETEADFPILKSTDSLMYRAEAIRAFLEKDLGPDRLLDLYAAITEEEYLSSDIDRMLGNVSPGIVVLLQQLLILDERISEQ